MSYLVRFQSNILGILVLIILHLFVKLSTIKTFSKKLIKLMIYAVTASLVVEPFSWILDERQFAGAFLLNHLFNFLLFLLAPVLAGLFMSYLDYRIYRNPSRIYEKRFYQQMTLISFMILLVNLWIPIYYSIDPVTNHYDGSGPIKWFHYVMVLGFYGYMLYFLYQVKDKLSKNEILMFILLFILPVIGMVISIFEPTFHLGWSSLVIGLLGIYVFLETTPSEEDVLTKVYNRKSFESYVEYLEDSKIPYGLLILDLNGFKQINDVYGHQKGDDVLTKFSALLREVFLKDGFVARLGGDEFAVILMEDEPEVPLHMKELKNKLKELEDPVMGNVSFSYGYESKTAAKPMREMYRKADQKMYQYKDLYRKEMNDSREVEKESENSWI
ncbi:MAG TPA: GGDEF domain-containing protein [Proteiniclasticum sp.]|uniref:GGDEF domain-containing protein n=1 Tax=Proteiniclasticum sp. TaxID=2053595 RepID=UPI000E9FD943|nr:GGDEF domain-containing protein [Proteiniclasticum sp.]HBW14305.1 GGDEF domain-containing protein [Proteiniclasticum sp.]